MPSLATSRARVFKKPVNPARAVFDKIKRSIGSRTELDVIAKMRPHFCCCIAGTTA